MKTKQLRVYAGSFLALAGFAGCSTEAEQPLNEENISRIEINLDCEETVTRAADHSGHKLRYVATLYQGTANNTNGTNFIRKELIDGETGDQNRQNFLVFDVDPGKSYTIELFADYIPEEATLSPTTMGNVTFQSYGNFYYDTTREKDVVYMLSTPELPNSIKADPKFFNNDNYDCFAHTESFDKTSKNYVINTKLKRMVSKVRFVDNSQNSGNYKIGVKRLGYYRQLDLVNSIASGITSFDSSSEFEEVSVESNKAISNSEKEVIYFYSFATKNESNREEAVYLTFTTTPSSGGTQSIVAKDLSIKRNNITTVTGQFLTEDLGSSNDPGSDTPTIPPMEEDGPVYLYLGIETQEWGELSSSWN